MEAAVVAMEGDALRWFQWENCRHSMSSWDNLKVRVLRQFRSANSGTLHEQWLAVKQETSVHEYRKKFIETASPLLDVPESLMLGHFINGLKEDLRDELRVLSLFSMDDAMDLVGRIEERNRVGSKKGAQSVKGGLNRTFGGPNSTKGPFGGGLVSTYGTPTTNSPA